MRSGIGNSPSDPFYVSAVGSGGGAQTVQGDLASGAVDSGNPVKVGAVYNSTIPVVDAGDRTDLQATSRGSLRVMSLAAGTSGGDAFNNTFLGGLQDEATTTPFGRMLIVAPHGFNGTTWDRQRGDTNGLVVQQSLGSAAWAYAAPTGGLTNTTTAVTFVAAGGAGVRSYVSAIQISWDALTNATEFAIRSGAGGTVLWRMKIPSGAAGVREVEFSVPIKSAANTLLEIVTLTASGAGSVFFNAQGYQGS